MKGLRTGDRGMDERVKIDLPLEGLDDGPIPDDGLIAREREPAQWLIVNFGIGVNFFYDLAVFVIFPLL